MSAHHDTAEARFESREAAPGWTLALSGAWTTPDVAAVDAPLRALAAPAGTRALTFDLSAVAAFDTAGAWLVHRTARALEEAGIEIRYAGETPAARALLDTVAGIDHGTTAPPPRPGSFVAMVERVGRATVEAGEEARDLVAFLGHALIVLAHSMVRPSRIRLTPLVHHIEQTGLNAMPIIGLISFLIGVVLAFQSVDQLSRFGAEIYTVNIVAQGVLREMGVLLTAIMIAGRSGSAFTAQIGTMVVREEVDAMRTIGLDPMEVLVLPRLWSLVIVLPLLAFFADVMGLLGGAVMATAELGITPAQFMRQLSDAVTMWTFWVGIIKAPVFGFVIGLVGCYEGLRVTGSAESVGRMTTRSVVESIFLVIVLDALFSIMFSILGI